MGDSGLNIMCQYLLDQTEKYWWSLSCSRVPFPPFTKNPGPRETSSISEGADGTPLSLYRASIEPLSQEKR